MSDDQQLRDRVIQIEELLSHQEHVIQQLNDVVLQIRSDYDVLKSRFQEHISRLEAQLEHQSSPYDADEKPPHY